MRDVLADASRVGWELVTVFRRGEQLDGVAEKGSMNRESQRGQVLRPIEIPQADSPGPRQLFGGARFPMRDSYSFANDR